MSWHAKFKLSTALKLGEEFEVTIRNLCVRRQSASMPNKRRRETQLFIFSWVLLLKTLKSEHMILLLANTSLLYILYIIYSTLLTL